MNVVEFNPDDYSAESLRLIMLRVEQWGCSPSEAVIRLLDELVAKQKEKSAA